MKRLIRISFTVMALAAASLLLVARASAHELGVDELALRPNLVEGRLRGQLTFDPGLTRGRAERLLSSEIEARILALVARAIAVEADGRRLDLTHSLREIYVPAGAAPGDIVMLDAALPKDSRQLRVHVGKEFRALGVSIDASGPAGPSAGERSVLVMGGAWSPPYVLAGAPGADWTLGPASRFAAAAPPHEEPADAQRASPVGASPPGFADESATSVAVSYLRLGVTHILPSGLDHVLFVLALVLGAGYRPRRLILLLSLFTLAHSVTLVLGALDWVVLRGSLIEPLIALSIAFVALENLFFEGRQKLRPYVVVAFGLLHGMGFAGALKETGIAERSFVLSLLSFNVGVELGQLAVALVGVSLLVLAARRPGAEQKLVRLGSVAIALAGLAWTAERLVS